MSTQLGLFDRRAPYQRDSATSKAAAEAIEPRAGTKRAIVLAFIRGRGALGATNEEISAGCGLQIQTVCPRVVELRECKLIKDGLTRRPTQSGNNAVVWVMA
ncbi:MAG: hypothetical protein HY749_16100 [Gammaproteobacteria bacterium]|nr:hypothetical protein [Gammaproteobacteria bacterium]